MPNDLLKKAMNGIIEDSELFLKCIDNHKVMSSVIAYDKLTPEKKQRIKQAVESTIIVSQRRIDRIDNPPDTY